MRTSCTVFLIGLLGCTKSGTSPEPGARPPTVTDVKVTMSAVTLAGDCGQGKAPAATAEGAQAESKRAPRSELEGDSDREYAKRAAPACEQTSMQLAVTGAPGGAPTQLRVKLVELLDDKGMLIGPLASRMPAVWSKDGTYQPWDQLVAPAQSLSVTYPLSEPPWSGVHDRRSGTYVLRAVITIGSSDQTIQREVQLIEPAAAPADVET